MVGARGREGGRREEERVFFLPFFLPFFLSRGYSVDAVDAIHAFYAFYAFYPSGSAFPVDSLCILRAFFFSGCHLGARHLLQEERFCQGRAPHLVPW